MSTGFKKFELDTPNLKILLNQYLNPYIRPCWYEADSAPIITFLKSINKSAFPTPLYSLSALAERYGCREVQVKDESTFPNLNSFKGRGALWAMANICAKELDLPSTQLSYQTLSQALAKMAEPIHFVTATDGNHGAAVAYGANLMRQKATIFLPSGTEQSRINTVRNFGAQAIITDRNYDDTVELANNYAKNENAILLQDTSWAGYEEIPGFIMQGYASLAHELAQHTELPTHVFLQAGVGSFAAAMVAAFSEIALAQGKKAPIFISLEPLNAACIYQSLKSGKNTPVTDDLATIMAGLACGKTATLAWPTLQAGLFASLACADELALTGMRILANPTNEDPTIISGESGAIGIGVLEHIFAANRDLLENLGLNQDSRVLLISTEGATNPELWQKSTGKSL